MAADDDEYVLIESELGGEFSRDGITVDVQIYRGQEDTTWILEVVDAANNSYVWDVEFLTDQAAMNEFLASVKRAGMKQYNN